MPHPFQGEDPLHLVHIFIGVRKELSVSRTIAWTSKTKPALAELEMFMLTW